MVLGHRRASSARSSEHESHDEGDETVVDPEQGNILMHIISQLRPGADLSRVTLPTFILEPRSMLERITNFMAHPELLLPMNKIDDPTQRFLSVVKFYLSGWHIKPPGVKKPLNPILGETFTCYWEYPDKSKGYYIAEQTSHHPPKSSYFFMVPEHGVRIDGCLKPRSKFLGNSAASMMEGIAIMRFLNRKERYFVTQPNMYARGILFGKMKYELGDHAFIRCPELNLMADIEFKTKGYFGGTYNAIGGVIKEIDTDHVLYELSGLWNEEMFAKEVLTGHKELLFNAKGAKATYPTARALDEQDERESQRLWHEVTDALNRRDHNAATTEKTRIEDQQRAEASRRADEGIDWRPRLFRPVNGGTGGSEEGEEDLDWILKGKIDATTSDEQIKQILQIASILPGQSADKRFSIPSRRSTANVNEDKPEDKPTSSPTAPSKPVVAATSENEKPGEPSRAPAHQPKELPPADDTYLLTGDLSKLNVKSEAEQQTQNLEPGSIRRMDSETQEMDVFRDAHS